MPRSRPAKARASVLVTGARGKTGREVVRLLSERGVPVRAGSRSPGAGSRFVDAVRFDWENPATWEEAVAGADAIYLMRPDLEDAPERVRELVRQAPEAHVVLLSEQGAGALRDTSWERRVETAVTGVAAGWTLIRPSWFHQVLTDPRFYLSSIRDEGSLSISSAGATIAFVDARDIAAVVVAALEDREHTAGEAYTVTGPAAMSVAEVAEVVSVVTGRPVRAVDPSPQEAVAGLDPWLAEIFGGVLARVRGGVFGEVTDDVLRLTGHPPRAVADFVREHEESWRVLPD